MTDTVQPTPSQQLTVSIVIPAFNEGETIGRVVAGARAQCPDAEILVVDDASSDGTADQAAAAGARVIRRPYNVGNGAGVKTGIRAAGGDVILILDADGQHDPADIPRLLSHIGRYDMVVGERSRSGQENAWRWLGNAALNRLGSYLVGLDMRGVVAGVIVADHHEPYGYFSVDTPEFATQFKGKSVRDEFRVGKDVQAISRATLTVTSATRAIRNSSRRIATALIPPPR